ncbi:MAG: hydrogenase maturation nickel metallochaperone HypA [Desulfobacterales bacterium]
MHEMGIALQVIDIATAAIPPEMRGCRVERVNLRIGKLSAVVVDSLNFCLEIATRDTPLAEAVFSIEEIPVVAQCRECGHEWQVARAVFKCPQCGSGNLEMISGRELDVVSIDIEEPVDSEMQNQPR